jgi:glycosyltransferase involved in cell wall biosynthesis
MIYKILYVIDNLEFGGGERGFLQLIKGLDRNRYRIHVAALAGGEFYKMLKAMGIQTIAVDMSYKCNRKAVKTLVDLLKEENYNIVHSQGARADFFTRLAVGLSKRSNLICTVQMPADGFNVSIFRKALYRLLDRLTEKYVDGFIVVSNELKRLLIERHRIPPDKIFKVPNGVEIDYFKPDVPATKIEFLREFFGLDKSSVVIGAVGRFCWQKGFDILIRSIPEIAHSNPDLKVILVGAGALKGRLEGLAESLNVLENIVFAGFRRDIKQILAAVDLLVVPSLREGFPMIVLEAMAMAKPIVASDLPGMSEQIVNGETGILVAPKNVDALTYAINELLASRGRANDIGLKARQYVVNNFSFQTMVAKTERVYQNFLAEMT